MVPGTGPEFITVSLCEMAFRRRRIGFRPRSTQVSGVSVACDSRQTMARRLGLQLYYMIILCKPDYMQTSAFPVRPFEILCVDFLFWLLALIALQGSA